MCPKVRFCQQRSKFNQHMDNSKNNIYARCVKTPFGSDLKQVVAADESVRTAVYSVGITEE